MNTKKRIFVVGSSNTDMVVKAKNLPRPGETILGGTFIMNAGGKGANQAVAAARLGGNVTFVTKVGNDSFGEKIIEGFKKENINTDFVLIDENAPSGIALISVNEEGENCIVVAPGANANLLPSDIRKVNQMHQADLILMQLEIPMPTIEAVAKKAKAFHQKVMINPAPAQPLSDELLHDLFLLTPNETEASLLTGINVVDKITASDATKVLLEKGVQHVIITLGKNGAYYRDANTSFYVPALSVDVKDTTAAGDTFNGAIAVAITAKMNWEDAVGFAVEAASISVTRMGAQASVPYRYELSQQPTTVKI